MAARRLVERRNPDQTVNAGFGRQQPVGVLARHENGRTLQPCFIAGLIIDQFAFEAPAFCPAKIHAEQHLRPILRLGSASARMDREDGVLAIVLATEHFLDLAGLHFLIERIKGLAELSVDGFSSLRPFDEHRQIVALLFQRSNEIELLLQPATALQNLLGFGLVFPEIRRGGARLEAG